METNIQTLSKKIKELPPGLQHEAIDFIEFLLAKYKNKKKGKRPFGLCKGEIKISKDFYEPIDDETLKSWGML